MPTQKKKFQCYLSPEAWEALQAHRHGDSEPWGQVLERLLLGGITRDTLGDTPPDFEARLQAVEAAIAALSDTLAIPRDTPRVIPRDTPRVIPRDTPVIPPSAPPGDAQGITQAELCDRYRVNASNVAREAKGAGFESAAAYLASVTGWVKVGRKWYPPSE